jgi:hypothetical protein
MNECVCVCVLHNRAYKRELVKVVLGLQIAINQISKMILNKNWNFLYVALIEYKLQILFLKRSCRNTANYLNINT